MRRERQIVGIKRAPKDGFKFGRKDVVDEDITHKGLTLYKELSN
ncbi:hypothetical protein OAT79_00085 [Gammaproteobacteria bacterium]|nr:hypothetical protein [Gammaproteobacteria bacterium]